MKARLGEVREALEVLARVRTIVEGPPFSESISVVLALAKEKGIVTKEVDRRKLDEMSQTSSHQGVMAVVTPYKYFGLNDIFKYAEGKRRKAFYNYIR